MNNKFARNLSHLFHMNEKKIEREGRKKTRTNTKIVTIWNEWIEIIFIYSSIVIIIIIILPHPAIHPISHHHFI